MLTGDSWLQFSGLVLTTIQWSIVRMDTKNSINNKLYNIIVKYIYLFIGNTKHNTIKSLVKRCYRDDSWGRTERSVRVKCSRLSRTTRLALAGSLLAQSLRIVSFDSHLPTPFTATYSCYYHSVVSLATVWIQDWYKWKVSYSPFCFSWMKCPAP